MFEDRAACATMALFSAALDGARTAIQSLQQQTDPRLDPVLNRFKSAAANLSSACLAAAAFGFPGDQVGLCVAGAAAVIVAAAQSPNLRLLVDVSLQAAEGCALWHLSQDAAAAVLAPVLMLAAVVGHVKHSQIAGSLVCLGNMSLKCYLFCKHIDLPHDLRFK